MPIGSTLLSLARLARLSNAPTCIGNVLVGVVAADVATGFRPATATLTTAGVVLLYAAGMMLNDLVDVEVDRRERPHRPLPSGRVTIEAARNATAVALALGWGLLALQGWASMRLATVLVIAIVLYDLLHRRTAASVLLMGVCRGLVYAVAAVAATDTPAWSLVAWPALAMAGYVVALSLVARHEASADRPDARRRLSMPSLVLPVMALVPLPALAAAGDASWAVLTPVALAVVAWLAYASSRLTASPPRIGGAVEGWLAGMCIVDGLWLVALGAPSAAAVAGACFVMTLLGHRWVEGT